MGYEILCSTATLKTLDVGMEAKLYIHFHQVQDAVTLYGFATKEERAMVPAADRRIPGGA